MLHIKIEQYLISLNLIWSTKMKIAYASDLHLDFDFPDFNKFKSDAPYLILAGDIMESRFFAKRHPQLMDLFKFLSEHYVKVVFISGNHEYYHSRIDKTDRVLADFADEFHNIVYLNNTSTMLGDYKVFGGTFWTDMGTDTDKYFIKQGMNDFKLITTKAGGAYRKFSPWDAAILHAKALEALKKSDPDIVVMHHGPTELSLHPNYKRHNLNAAYASRVFQTHLEYGNEYKGIIHGHIHHTLNYNYCGTPIMANPRGYDKYDGDLAKNWSVKVWEL